MVDETLVGNVFIPKNLLFAQFIFAKSSLVSYFFIGGLRFCWTMIVSFSLLSKMSATCPYGFLRFH